ncbi:MAG: DUF3857 domain-containing protein [Planctomycetes bacterium]|nr:DUF3857 domain-containing protein [Planctomycetota bacterium]
MRRKLKITGIIFALFLAAMPFPAFSEEAIPESLIDAKAAVEACKATTREQYPNSDTVLVDKYILIKYNADGTYTQFDENYTKILTEKGKRGWQTVSSWYNTVYNSTEFRKLEIIKADGTVVPIDIKKMSRDMADPSDLAQNIVNPKSRVLEVSVPDLQIGDSIHYVMYDAFFKSRVKDTFSEFTTFESTEPIMHKTFEIVGPKEKPLLSIALKSGIKDKVKYTREEKDGRIVYKWDINSVPRMYPEPSMPPVYMVVQRLIVSTAKDWPEISRWYWNLCKPHLETTPEMEAKVKELVGGIEDRQKKIKTLFKWVSQEIRYAGITVEAEAPGYEPHDVKMTFENKHGVCRDKAALLAAMLRLAGFEAFPVLIHNGPKKDAEVPTSYFNHAITAVREADGSYQLMDSTDENTKRIFPAYLSNKSYLVATPEGEPLLTSPVSPADENMMEISTTGTLDASGNLKAESTFTFNGINDNAYRGYFSRIKPEERRRLFEGRIKDAAPGARITSFEIKPEDMMDTGTGLSVKLAYEADAILIKNGTTVMLPLPQLGKGIGMVNFLIGQTGLPERKYPLLTDIACGVKENIKLTVNDAFGKVISLPDYTSIDSDTIGLDTKVDIVPLEKPGSASISSHSTFSLKTVEWTPEQYLFLKDTLKKIEYDRRKMPILEWAAKENTPAAVESAEKKPGKTGEQAADVVIHESKVDYDIAPSGTEWTETRYLKKEILTYAGKKKNSELKLSYNPAWEKIEVVMAKTTAKDGTVKEISAQEINEVDQGWVGSAPRYPAGKILVANIPGVEEGCTVEYTVKRTCKNRPFFSAREYFRSLDPIDSKTLTIHRTNEKAGQDTQFSIFTMNNGHIKTTKNQDGDRETITLSAEKIKATQGEDSMPPWYGFNPTVFISNGSWEKYGHEVLGILTKNTEGQVKTESKTKEIVGKLETDKDKLCAIRDYVALNIRNAGPSLDELPLTSLTPADKTLEEGYGVAADRAAVIFTMLHAAGFKPEFVLASNAPIVSSLQEPMRKSPDTSWLGTVLVKIELDGETIYLNDTDQYDALGSTPHDLRQGLDPTTGKFVNIRAAARKDDRSETEYDITLTPEGSAIIARTEKIYGSAFGNTKKLFAEMPPEERRRWHMEAIADISQSAVPDGELVTNFVNYPGILGYSVKVENFAVRDGKHLYLALPETMKNFLRLRGDNRVNPLYLPSPERETITYHITVPAEFSEALMLPAAAIESNGIKASITASKMKPKGDGLQFDIIYSGEIMPSVIAPEKYGELLDIYSKLSHPGSRMILLTTKAEQQ